MEEFGLSLTETAAFIAALSTLGFQQQTAACWLPLSVMKDTLGPLLEWTSERINAAFSLFALEPRGEGDEPAPGFEKERDIAPWKHNRRLSYLRRPLIVSSDSDGDPLVYWGPRHAYKAWNHLVYLVFSGRYNADNACRRMKVLTGRIRKEKGDRFGESLGAWLSDQTEWQIETAVDIGPKRPLCAPQALGDVDVLCIDRSRRRLYAIECKDFQFARTPPAMKRESDDLLNTHIPQHQKRHAWLESNKELVAKVCKVDTANFEVISLLITSTEIPSTYLHEIPLPHRSFPALQREGVAWLEGLGQA